MRSILYLATIALICWACWRVVNPLPDDLRSSLAAESPDSNEPAGPPEPKKSATNPRPDDFDASESTQAEREAVIQGVIRDGWVLRTEFSGSLPKLWIVPEFAALPLKDQTNVCSVVYAYWMGEVDTFGRMNQYAWEPLVLKVDNGGALGRRVGQYDPLRGLEWND